MHQPWYLETCSHQECLPLYSEQLLEIVTVLCLLCLVLSFSLSMSCTLLHSYNGELNPHSENFQNEFSDLCHSKGHFNITLCCLKAVLMATNKAFGRMCGLE